jgi:hypothetical protein
MTTRGRATPSGGWRLKWVADDSVPHALRGRLSRILEKTSNRELLGCGATTILLIVGWAATVLTFVAVGLLGLNVHALGAAEGLDAGFLALAVLLLAVTFGCLGASVT